MANEIKATINVNVTNGNFKDLTQPGTINIDQSVVGQAAGVLNVDSTTPEAIPVTDLTTYGIVYLRNLDATNPIVVGSSTGRNLFRLKAGEPFFGRFEPGARPHVHCSSTGGTNLNLLYKVFDD